MPKPASFRAAASLAVLILAAGCEKGPGAEQTAEFTAAADALSEKVEAASKQGQTVPASDPAVKAFQDQSARALEALGTPALPVDGFDSFQPLCGKTAAVVQAYLTAGVGGGTDAEKAAAMERNAAAALETIFTPLLFAARCTAAHMPFLEETAGDKAAAKPEAQQQVRTGAQAQLAGLLQLGVASDLDPARRRQALDVAAANAGNFAIALNQAQRGELAALAGQVAGALQGEDAARAQKAKQAIEGAPCNALCKL
jgi:hypothetical protein